ncbi:cell envelope biogenesis protein OmpA [Roseovarius faecimaris]|uniref:Cell envelope biogenesis protein OmpA n=1 Tax=Roseovarius faecimaris TaxID=2494550 RepID=A0A6I6ITM4_9RHOB|nr:phosphate ABC transporter substrate-binding/OmpA family protein [Roseovarius faecimaris]QGY00096.1 cell envelope biogenesis protein OmpA [Roseovarius faecimaris]
MTRLRAAVLAALLLFGMAPGASAQDVTLTSRDGDVEISGNLLGFDGEFYRVDTIYGELTVDGSGVDCEGPGCPNLNNFVARITLAGEPAIGRVLMPGLLEAFAIKSGYSLERESRADADFSYRITDKSTGQLLGEFDFQLTNSDEGFADLLADEADIVMSLREVRPEEVKRARDAGLGNLLARGRSKVVALDALVPVVSPTNPVQDITAPQLADVLSGKITNWAVLGGPDAPIDVQMLSNVSGLGQAVADQVLRPASVAPAPSVTWHESDQSLLAAVMADPFAIAVTRQSDTGSTWPLALKGQCGFAMKAMRRAVKTEDYPLTMPLFLYMPARRFPKLVREFLTYLRDPSAQLVIRRAGFVDQTPEEIEINAQGDRFANAISRAGEEVSLGQLQAMVRALAPLKRLTTTFRFETGSTRLDAQSRSNVLQLARAMELGHYDARRLVFVGFSDGQGPAEGNLEIARKRAEAVRAAVTRAAETANLARISIETIAFGEAMPMACDTSEWGRRVNRRVEVWVR